jgi:flagellar basal body-associated protein FliL
VIVVIVVVVVVAAAVVVVCVFELLQQRESQNSEVGLGQSQDDHQVVVLETRKLQMLHTHTQKEYKI